MLKNRIKKELVDFLDAMPPGSYSDVLFFTRRTGENTVWGIIENYSGLLPSFLVDLAKDHEEFDEALMLAYFERCDQKEEEELRKKEEEELRKEEAK